MNINELIDISKNVYGVVYLLRNTINNKIYVGQTKNLKSRLKDYRFKNLENDIPIMISCLLYQIMVSIISQWKYWISELNSTNIDIGYNRRTGGRGGKLNIESRKKMSVSSFGFKHTDLEKLKRSKPILVYYNGYIQPYESAKKLSDELKTSRSVVSAALKRAGTIRGRYIFYADPHERKIISKKFINSKTKEMYNMIIDYLGDVETIRRYVILCR